MKLGIFVSFLPCFAPLYGVLKNRIQTFPLKRICIIYNFIYFFGSFQVFPHTGREELSISQGK